MIICSCNIITTSDIEECVKYHPNPTPKTVLKSLGWEADCSSCCDNIVKEIREVINNRKNSLGDDYD